MPTPLLVLAAIGCFALVLGLLAAVGRWAYRKLNRVCGACGWTCKIREVTTPDGISLFESYCPLCSMLQAAQKSRRTRLGELPTRKPKDYPFEGPWRCP